MVQFVHPSPPPALIWATFASTLVGVLVAGLWLEYLYRQGRMPAVQLLLLSLLQLAGAACSLVMQLVLHGATPPAYWFAGFLCPPAATGRLLSQSLQPCLPSWLGLPGRLPSPQRWLPCCHTHAMHSVSRHRHSAFLCPAGVAYIQAHRQAVNHPEHSLDTELAIAQFAAGTSAALYCLSFFPMAWPHLLVAFMFGYPVGGVAWHVLASTVRRLAHAFASDALLAYIVGLINAGHGAGGPASTVVMRLLACTPALLGSSPGPLAAIPASLSFFPPSPCLCLGPHRLVHRSGRPTGDRPARLFCRRHRRWVGSGPPAWGCVWAQAGKVPRPKASLTSSQGRGAPLRPIPAPRPPPMPCGTVPNETPPCCALAAAMGLAHIVLWRLAYSPPSLPAPSAPSLPAPSVAALPPMAS